MANFNLGDRVRITLNGSGSYIDTDFISTDLENQEKDRGFRHEGSQRVYDYEGVVSDENLTLEVITPVADRLPTVPGGYAEIPGVFIQVASILTDEDGELTDAELIEFYTGATGESLKADWTLNQDNTWTDNGGLTKPESWNWVLAVSGSKFVLVD